MICDGRNVEIGPARWAPWLYFDGQGGGLGGYRLVVMNLYQNLRAVAVGKFGEPTTREVVKYNSRLGDLEGERLTWTWPSGTIARLEERCTHLDQSCLNVYTRDYIEALGVAQQKGVDRAKKQF